MSERRQFQGWGRTAPVMATAVTGTAGEVGDLLRSAGPRGLIARGLGRSYGDAAQNSGGEVLLPIEGQPRLVGDRVVAAAGTSLHDLIRFLLPHGRFLPVTPGTRYVSVGGAIACDVHGKSHHVTGTFGAHVDSFDLVTPDGTTRTVTAEGEPELFWATVGGMGLTGVVTSATLRTIAVESGWVDVTTDRFEDLHSLMAAMREGDDAWTYSVAWVDTLSRGRSGAGPGRSVLTRGEHAARAALDARRSGTPYPLPGDPRLGAPRGLPSGLVSPLSVRAFNELWFRKAPRHRSGELQTLATFFHPLDGVADWNRLYGPAGFVQYQLVVPDEAGDVVRDAVATLAASGHASFLAVLKRFGPANAGLLSFPMAGWTLALDLPARPGLGRLLDRLDDAVVEAGGRIYLAKDSRLRADRFAAMYPRREEFARVRDRVDPGRVLSSDLARRLDL
ncbi:FAD-binding oxidoreductase [Nocardioides cynanchi]|uniref:FAD-binding oxidoreductase n=1 Tax=Nocardioides cynanchi TaxID=2558918 RepID=UPI00192DB952|nr:FAD-binding oxidoreductase [Nocardioides cynanchi]